MAGKSKLDYFDLKFIVSKMEQARTSGISFNAFVIDDLHLMLQTGFPFFPATPRSERVALLDIGISQAMKLGPLTAETLTRTVHDAERSFLRRPRQRYLLASTISFTLPSGIQQLRRRSGRIVVARRFSAGITAARANTESHIDSSPDVPNGFSAIVAKVDARSPNEALDIALRDINRLRSWWNFELNRNVLTRYSAPPEAVNRIRLGNAHTLHKPTGQLAVAGHWSARNTTFRPATLLASEWQKMNRSARMIGAA